MAVRGLRAAARRGGVGCVVAVSLLAFGGGGCAPEIVPVNHVKPRMDAEVGSGDQSDTFGYRRWISPRVEPDVVLIGIHGFCGAAIDYANLGNHLLARQPRTGLYAYEVRGQGSDPIRERRGDIGDPRDWYRDLDAFTQLVRERHPGAKIVWFGESMGALIAAHALRNASGAKPPCDGLVLSSPVVRFRDDVPAWKIQLVQIGAAALPLARVSLEALAGGQELPMTQTSGSHLEQAGKNEYHIKEYTLRLLGALGQHIEGMDDCAAALQVPVLVLHGGKDFFCSDGDVREFVSHVPEGVSRTYRNYPDAYHLLMYDEERTRIFRDVERWLNRLRRGRLGGVKGG